jgi:hypothetical protein
MDIGKAFTFVFEDEDWVVKIVIAAAVLLAGIVVGSLCFWIVFIPTILAFALPAGYAVEITRRVIGGRQDALPEWDEWGELFIDGIKVILIGIVYYLPQIVISAILGPIIGFVGDQASGLGALFGSLLGCFNLLWFIFASLVLPAAIAFYADRGQLSDAFRFGEILGFVRDNLTTYVITAVMSWVAGVVGALGILVCGVGALVTGPYAWMVTGHLYGQAYLEASGQMVPADLDEVV